MNTKGLLIAASLSMMALTGCAGANTSVSDGSEKLMTIGSKTYTKQDEYQLIKRVNGPALTLQATQQLIFDEEVGKTDEIMEQAEGMYNTYAASSDDFEAQLKSYGYENKEDYINNVLVPSVQSTELTKKYFTDCQAAIDEEFKPVKVEIIQCDSEDNASKAQEAMKNGEKGSEVAEQYAATGAAYMGNAQIITKDNTALPARLVNTLSETTASGVLDEIFSDDTSTDDKSYYAVNIVSTDYTENLDDIITALSSNSEVQTDCTVYYLSKYGFEVHDQYIFDYWKVMNPEYLVTRPDLAETAENDN